MQAHEREKWQELCELAANEHDHDRLIDLAKQINDLLRKKYDRLEAEHKIETT